LKLSQIFALLILIASLFSFILPAAFADRGGIPLLEPDIIAFPPIFEPGQKAIIAWNGTEEILVLSTDLHTNETMMVLEILPLPSNPKTIKKASDMSFAKAQDIVRSHAPRVFNPYSYFLKELSVPVEIILENSVEITFHEKIGTHDITVVKPRNVTEFASWIEIFLEHSNITQEASLQNFETILENYIANGFDHFVLDLIELSATEQSVEPIFYEFKTSSLYYPLKISSRASGETKITLFLLTREAIDEMYCFPFRYAYYGSSPSIMSPIVQFTVGKGEIQSIDENINHLFDNYSWFTTLQYSGQNSAFTGDFALPIWTFRLSYFTLLFRAVLRYLIAALPIEIMIGFVILSIASKPFFRRKDAEIYLR